MKQIIAALMLTVFAAFPAMAEEAPRLLSVTGTGEVAAEPDQVSIEVGVLARGDSAQAAMAQMTRQMQALFNVIKGSGLPERNFQTHNLSLSPWYRDNRRTDLGGFEARNTVIIRLEDIPALGGLLDRLTRAGANQINSIRFGFTDSAALVDAARKAAVKDGQAKAALYAAEAGVTLGPLQSLTEHGGTPRPVARGMEMMAMSAPADVPIAGGELSLSASVSMVFAIQ